MTTPNDPRADEPEPAEVGAACAEAQSLVRALATYLQGCGWHAIVLSLSRRVEVGGKCYAPGATATVIDVHRVGPLAWQLAAVMRKQADALEANARGAEPEGYIQDRTDYASGMREWPR